VVEREDTAPAPLLHTRNTPRGVLCLICYRAKIVASQSEQNIFVQRTNDDNEHVQRMNDDNEHTYIQNTHVHAHTDSGVVATRGASAELPVSPPPSASSMRSSIPTVVT